MIMNTNFYTLPLNLHSYFKNVSIIHKTGLLACLLKQFLKHKQFYNNNVINFGLRPIFLSQNLILGLHRMEELSLYLPHLHIDTYNAIM